MTNEKKVIREMSRMLKVDAADVPRTLRRFREEVEAMKRQLKGNV